MVGGNMKIIRPEQPIKKKEENLTLIIDGHEVTEFKEEELIDDNTNKDQTIENLMDEIIKQKDDKIQVTISLTKRQYNLYLKKGGEAWVKKVITGQHIKKKSTKKR
jgi:hypothetical protein